MALEIRTLNIKKACLQATSYTSYKLPLREKYVLFVIYVHSFVS